MYPGTIKQQVKDNHDKLLRQLIALQALVNPLYIKHKTTDQVYSLGSGIFWAAIALASSVIGTLSVGALVYISVVPVPVYTAKYIGGALIIRMPDANVVLKVALALIFVFMSLISYMATQLRKHNFQKFPQEDSVPKMHDQLLNMIKSQTAFSEKLKDL